MTQKNNYDETKKLLQTIRKLNSLTPQAIREQLSPNKNLLGNEDDDVTQGWEPSDMDDETQSMKNSIQSYFNDHSQSANTQSANTQSANTQSSEKSDFAVINNIEVVINSTDEADFELNDDEKGKISQLIDDFRSEVSELTEFGTLNIYESGAKLDGNVKEVNLGFTLSAGDDNGLFLSNTAKLQLNDDTMLYINKLKKFQMKFNDIMGDLIGNRQQN